jgi:xylose isomerase
MHHSALPAAACVTLQFPMNLKDCAYLVQTILTQGGLAPGGLNFDAKVRRESTDVEDMFIAHIGSMDCFALALRRVAELHSSEVLQKMVAARYASYDSGLGQAIEAGKATFDDCEKDILARANQEPQPISGQQEKYEQLFNNYLHAKGNQ